MDPRHSIDERADRLATDRGHYRVPPRRRSRAAAAGSASRARDHRPQDRQEPAEILRGYRRLCRPTGHSQHRLRLITPSIRTSRHRSCCDRAAAVLFLKTSSRRRPDRSIDGAPVTCRCAPSKTARDEHQRQASFERHLRSSLVLQRPSEFPARVRRARRRAQSANRQVNDTQ